MDDSDKEAFDLAPVCTCGADKFNVLNTSDIGHDEDCPGAVRKAVAQRLRELKGRRL